MVAKLKEFQAIAASSAHNALLNFLKKNEDDKLAAAAHARTTGASNVSPLEDEYRIQIVMPCGMGKTVTLAAILSGDKTLYARDAASVKDTGIEDHLVLFVTPGQGGLAKQAYTSLKKELEPYSRNIILIDENTTLPKSDFGGTIIVAGYESLVQTDRKTGEFKNRVTKDGEFHNLWDMLSLAAASDVAVTFVVDESHYGSTRSSGSIKKFFATVSEVLGYHPVRIEATATPLKRGKGTDSLRVEEITASENAGVGEGMLRDKLVLDHGLKVNYDRARTYVSSIEGFKNSPPEPLVFADIMYRAWKPVADAAASLTDLPGQKMRYRPLMLVAINNADSGTEELENLKRYFKERGITVDNGKLGIWLDGASDTLSDRDKEVIATDESDIEVLIFKQAIALGWDCPRAQFLLMIRGASVASETFTPQLLGRIRRQPHGVKKGNDLLDIGYVFTAKDRVALSSYAEQSHEGMTTGGGSFDLVDAHNALWKSVEVCKRTLRRTNRAPAKTPEFIKALADVPLADTFPDEDEVKYLSKYHTDVDIPTDQKTLGAPTVLKETPTPSNVKRLTNELEKELQREFPRLSAASKHAQAAIPALIAWIQASLQKAGRVTDERDTYLYALLLHWLHVNSPSISDAIEACYKVASDAETANGGKWNEYVPSGGTSWDPISARSSAYATDTPIRMPMNLTHAYGDTSFEDGEKWRSEDLFEQDVLNHMLSDEDDPNGQTLVSWLRNSNRIDGDSKAFSYTYTAAHDANITHHSFPDYATLLRNSKGDLVPVMFEVKGIGTGESGTGKLPTIAKAAALKALSDADVVVDDPRHNPGGKSHRNDMIGCVTYARNGAWYAVTGGTSNGVFTEEPLKKWLSRYGIDV
ncbi:MAG: hypothetical protein E6R04_03355 [Spirochaetes bacterium]|nr:MAG: hypothetical protein E6R04_03355 [Spirochaetota bacterium]